MVLRNAIMICLVASLVACANNTAIYNPPPQIMSYEDLNYFKYDCKHAAEAKTFLEYQLRNISDFDINSRERGMILSILGQMRSDCGFQQPQPVACVHVREDMKSGSANATVCNVDPRGLRPAQAPIVNRWDPLVDMK